MSKSDSSFLLIVKRNLENVSPPPIMTYVW